MLQVVTLRYCWDVARAVVVRQIKALAGKSLGSVNTVALGCMETEADERHWCCCRMAKVAYMDSDAVLGSSPGHCSSRLLIATVEMVSGEGRPCSVWGREKPELPVLGMVVHH